MFVRKIEKELKNGRKAYWKKKIFWSNYFACSIGEVSSTTIQRYIESQG